MKKGIKKTTYFFLLIFFVFALAGCQKASIEPTEASDTTLEYYEFEAVTEIREGQPNIYVVLKVLTSQYWQDIVRGITDAGNAANCNVYVGATVGEAEWEMQELLLEQAENAGADAIILAPGNSSVLSEYVAELHGRGTPVILIDTILNDTESFDTCYMTDNLQAGQLAAEEMLRLMRESGLSEEESATIAIQITSVSSQTVIDRLAGFNQYWAINAPENWTVLDEIKLNNGDSELAQQNCIDLLEDYPDLKGVFGCNNSSTVGFANGLIQSGRTDVILVGFDYADVTAELVGSEDWTASAVVQNQYNMGYDGIMMAVELIKGNIAEFRFVDTETRVINHENHIEYEKSLAGEN